jgi:hypothetical protein
MAKQTKEKGFETAPDSGTAEGHRRVRFGSP